MPDNNDEIAPELAAELAGAPVDPKLQAAITDKMSRIKELSDEISRLESLLEERDDTISELEDEIDEMSDENDDLLEEIVENENPSSRRPPPHFKLPDERHGVTHKFNIGSSGLGHGYLTLSTYPDSKDVGEIFIKMMKPPEKEFPAHLVQEKFVQELHNEKGDLSAFLIGVLDQLAIAVSIGLQRGIPLEVYAAKYRSMRFPPDGMTRNPEIPICSSIVDYLFRYLGAKYIGTDDWVRNQAPTDS